MVDAVSGQQTSLKIPLPWRHELLIHGQVEAGMQLLERRGKGPGRRPLAGGSLWQHSGKLVLRLDKELGAKLEIGEA